MRGKDEARQDPQACRIDKPERFRLADYDPAEDFGLAIDKDSVKAMLSEGLARLTEQQEVLYAQGQWAVLVVLQGMDAAGKDSVIKHVMSGVNPQGCEVHPFKAPSEEELEYDFLRRAALRLPRRGRIGIFNRSYYEEVLVVRVHPDLLAQEKLPPSLDRQGHLEASLQGDPRVRASSRAQRHFDPEIPSARFQGGAAPALPGAPRGAGQALEVLDQRRRASASVGTITWRPMRT